MAKAWRTRAGLGDGCVQVGGCGAGCCCLGGVLLGLAQLGDRGGQRDELRHQSDGQEGGVAGQVPGQGDHPGGAA
jgi:hypothetical protein